MWIVTPHKWHMKWQGFWQNWKMSFFTIAIQSMEHSITFHFSPPDREYFLHVRWFKIGFTLLNYNQLLMVRIAWFSLSACAWYSFKCMHSCKIMKKNHQQANACSCLRLLLQELTVDNNSIRWQPIFVVQSAAL